jgi:hypothetical protein
MPDIPLRDAFSSFGRNRPVVRTSRCGRENLGSIPSFCSTFCPFFEINFDRHVDQFFIHQAHPITNPEKSGSAAN